MFAFKPRFETVFRILLAAAILFSAPMNVFSVKADDTTVTPTQTPSETPTAEPSSTPSETPIPATETPIPVTETPTPVVETSESPETETIPEPGTASRTGIENVPLLTLSSNPNFLTPGGIVNLNWSIEGIDLADLALKIFLPVSVTPHGTTDGTYDEASHTLSILPTARAGRVQLRADVTVSDVTIEATLSRNGETIASTSLFLPSHEQFVLDQQGGEIVAMEGRLKIRFPQNALHENTIIEVGAPSGDAVPANALTGNPFEINAHTASNNTELHQFDEEIEIEASYGELGIPEDEIENLYLHWYNPETQEWNALASSVDTTTGTVTGITKHFSIFDVGVSQWQSAMTPTVDDFQVSSFTGAGSFSLPIKVPAGPGGLQPSLALSYNSQVVDQSTTETQASWVGMGWSLETGSIVMDTADSSVTYDDTFFLNVGGVSTRLVYGDGEFHAANENFWKFKYDDGTDQWTVWDKVGNIYYFGLTADERSILAYKGDCDGPGTGGEKHITYRWELSRVRNIFGKELAYTYAKETKSVAVEQYSDYQKQCKVVSVPTDTAIYPVSILYPNGRYRVFFERESRSDYKAALLSDAVHHMFERTRLKNIYVQLDAAGTGFVNPVSDSSQTIRRYQLSYQTDPLKVIFPGFTYSAGGRVSTLSQVQEFGVGGTSYLPAYTFTYGDKLHLTKAENGYGGTVEFDYEDTDLNTTGIQPWYYTQATVKDYTILQEFGTEGHCNLEGWGARPNTGSLVTVNCGVNDPYLVVHGTAIHSGLTSGASLPMLRPGGVYRFTTTASFGSGLSIQVGANDGIQDRFSQSYTTSPASISYNLTLPGDATRMQMLIKTTGGATGINALLSTFKVQLLPSFYRVRQKKISDGKGHTYTYSYTYANPAVNDSAHSSVCPANQTGCTSVIEAYSEFRGNGTVTETGPDNQQTITTFSQDDIYKGMPGSVTVKDAGGKTITETIHTSSYTSMPMYIDPDFDYIGYGHYWVRPLTTEQRIYRKNGLHEASTRTVYTYESTYGNLTKQTEQSQNFSTGSWETQRYTDYYYWPKNASDTYLVSLPGKSVVYDGSNSLIGATLYLYGTNVSDHQTQPQSGVLTTVRTLARNVPDGTNYSQVTYTYDTWGNRTSEKTYDSYGTWNAAPSTGARTTYTCYGSDPNVSGSGTIGGETCAVDGYHMYPLWTKNALGQKTNFVYDYTKGVPTQEEDPNGAITYVDYDEFGRLKNIYRPHPETGLPENEASLTFFYQDYYPFTTTVIQKVDDSKYFMVQREYDGLGRQTKITSGPPSAQDPQTIDMTQQTIVDMIYFSPTETRETVPHAPTEQTPAFTKTTVNPADRTTTVTAPDQSTTTTLTDGLLTQVTDARGNTTTTTVDAWGHTAAVVPPTGPSLSYSYDALDRLRSVARSSNPGTSNPGTNGLISWWSMNETSGTRYDSHSSNQLTDNNTVGYAAGINASNNIDDHAASFVPANLESLSKTDNAALSTGNVDFTIVANVYLNSTTGTMVVVNKGDKNDQKKRDYTLYYTGGAFGLLVGNGTTTAAVTSSVTLAVGQWYTVIAWHDSVNDTLNIQVNNGDVSTVSYSGGALDTSFPLVIGAHSDGTFGLNGRIDEVALYKRVLRADERAWLFNGGSGRIYTFLPEPNNHIVHITRMTYDAGGRKTSMIDPDMGSWSYDYDALGNLKTQTDARGCILSLGYDALSRLTSKSSSGACGSPVTVTYGYDAGINGIGHRTSMSDSPGSTPTTWSYDKLGRLKSESKSITGTGPYNTSWGYNSGDLLTSMTYPDGEIVNYEYNDRMLLNRVYNASGNYVASTTYDAAGRMNLRTFANNTQIDYDYYDWLTQGGRLQSLKSGTSGNATSLQNLSYSYDAAGNIYQIMNNLTGANEKQVYKYDSLDRLRCWGLLTDVSGTSGCESYNESNDTFGPLTANDEEYRYAATGNLDIKAGVDLNYNDTDHTHAVTHIGTDQKYWYDANGNQIKRIANGQTHALEYDAENRLVKVCQDSDSDADCDSGETVVASFTYDGDGNRVKSVMGSETTVFIGGYYEVTNPGTQGQTVTKYYFAGATRVAMRKYTIPTSMAVEYFLGDHLGSTSVTTDSNGAKISEIKYKPWGEIRSSWTSGAVTTPAYKLAKYLYTGQFSYLDDPTTAGVTEGFGLMFYQARWYDPYLNHFTQPDSIVPDLYNPQAWDRYSYVFNNPLRYTDPTGHKGDDGCGAYGCAKENLLSKILSGFQNVDIKNPDDWKTSELHTLNNTLNSVLRAFSGNLRAFNKMFGNITFEVLPDGAMGGHIGETNWRTGLIRLTHDSFSSSGWTIAHEMGHMLDIRWSNGDPKKFFSQIFVDVLNGGCTHLGPHGCLGHGSQAIMDEFKADQPWYYFGKGYGEYFPSNNLTTVYGYTASTEDFAESFAGVITGDPNNFIGGHREAIINTIINSAVSYFSP